MYVTKNALRHCPPSHPSVHVRALKRPPRGGAAWWERDEWGLEGDVHQRETRPGCLRQARVDQIARGQSPPGRPASAAEGTGKGKRDKWVSQRVSRDRWSATIPGLFLEFYAYVFFYLLILTVNRYVGFGTSPGSRTS